MAGSVVVNHRREVVPSSGWTRLPPPCDNRELANHGRNFRLTIQKSGARSTMGPEGKSLFKWHGLAPLQFFLGMY